MEKFENKILPPEVLDDVNAHLNLLGKIPEHTREQFIEGAQYGYNYACGDLKLQIANMEAGIEFLLTFLTDEQLANFIAKTKEIIAQQNGTV